MPSTYPSNLKIELQATGENSGTWGSITNTNLGTALEQAIVGYGNPDFASDASLTLTYADSNAAQAARALVLNVTSTGSLTGTRDLVVPTIEKQYVVQNNTSGSQSITVKTSGGTGITVPNGLKAHLYVDGTNVILMDDYVDINGGSIDGTPIGANSASTGAFTDVTATSANITTLTGTTATYTTGSFTSANITTLTGTSATITTLLDGAGNIRNVPSAGIEKTAAYTLSISDLGEYVTVGSGGSITVPNDVFSAGNIISIFNNTTGDVTITFSITTAYLGGTDADKATLALATRGVATVLFLNPSLCVATGNVS